MKPQYKFATKIWTVNAKYKTVVEVFEDRAVIHRSGRTGDLPNESTVFFRETSAVLYGNSGRRVWIRLIVPNIVTAVKLNLYTIDNFTIPYIDPYAVIFSIKQKNEAIEHYKMIRKLFDAYKRIN